MRYLNRPANTYVQRNSTDRIQNFPNPSFGAWKRNYRLLLRFVSYSIWMWLLPRRCLCFGGFLVVWEVGIGFRMRRFLQSVVLARRWGGTNLQHLEGCPSSMSTWLRRWGPRSDQAKPSSSNFGQSPSLSFSWLDTSAWTSRWENVRESHSRSFHHEIPNFRASLEVIPITTLLFLSLKTLKVVLCILLPLPLPLNVEDQLTVQLPITLILSSLPSSLPGIQASRPFPDLLESHSPKSFNTECDT